MSTQPLSLSEERLAPPAPANAPSLRAETLLEGVVALLVLSVLQRVVGFVRAILFCRWLDPEQLGLWDMAYGFLIMAAPLAVLSLPGAFGRYGEQFRARGELRPFIRRTAAVCAATALAALAGLALCRHAAAQLIFGDAAHAGLMLTTVATMAAMIAYNHLASLFAALRNMRLVSVLDCMQSLLFAAFGVGLLAAGWAADGVVAAWGAACLACAAVSLVWLRRAWRETHEPLRPTPHRAFWARLAPFAAWVLVLNLLTNLFAIADRAMIVHFAPGSPDDTLALVGQYHSARVLPLLLISIAGLLATVVLPHLSHDWEAGRRERVSRQLTLFVKLTTFGMTAAAAGILLIAPWLFATAFANKYAVGLAALPWTLAACVWFGVTMVAQQYLWCAERARWVCLAVVAGLAVNVGLNLVLLPRLGLHGAVLAAAAANAVALTLVVLISRGLGFQGDRGLWVVLATPAFLALGWPAAVAALLVLALDGWQGRVVLDADQRQQLCDGAAEYLGRLRKLWNKQPR